MWICADVDTTFSDGTCSSISQVPPILHIDIDIIQWVCFLVLSKLGSSDQSTYVLYILVWLSICLFRRASTKKIDTPRGNITGVSQLHGWFNTRQRLVMGMKTDGPLLSNYNTTVTVYTNAALLGAPAHST